MGLTFASCTLFTKVPSQAQISLTMEGTCSQEVKTISSKCGITMHKKRYLTSSRLLSGTPTQWLAPCSTLSTTVWSFQPQRMMASTSGNSMEMSIPITIHQSKKTRLLATKSTEMHFTSQLCLKECAHRSKRRESLNLLSFHSSCPNSNPSKKRMRRSLSLARSLECRLIQLAFSSFINNKCRTSSSVLINSLVSKRWLTMM